MRARSIFLARFHRWFFLSGSLWELRKSFVRKRWTEGRNRWLGMRAKKSSRLEVIFRRNTTRKLTRHLSRESGVSLMADRSRITWRATTTIYQCHVLIVTRKLSLCQFTRPIVRRTIGPNDRSTFFSFVEIIVSGHVVATNLSLENGNCVNVKKKPGVKFSLFRIDATFRH